MINPNKVEFIENNTIKMYLTQGLFTILDAKDYPKIRQYKWYARKTPYTFYASTNVNNSGKRKTIQLHRAITDAPIGMEVDHKDRNGLNNTRANLRVCTKEENQHNASIRKDNTSGFKGIYWMKSSSAWAVSIQAYGKRIYCGIYKSKNEAILVRDKKIRELHKDFAKT